MRTKCISDRDYHRLHSHLNARNGLIIEIGTRTGMRIGDILKMTIKRLSEAYTYKEEKTKKTRTAKIPLDLLKKMKYHSRNNSMYVFESRYPRHITQQAVSKQIKEACKELNIKDNINTHSMRKKYAHSVYEATGSLDKVREALNHDRADTTLVYLVDL